MWDRERERDWEREAVADIIMTSYLIFEQFMIYALHDWKIIDMISTIWYNVQHVSKIRYDTVQYNTNTIQWNTIHTTRYNTKHDKTLT